MKFFYFTYNHFDIDFHAYCVQALNDQQEALKKLQAAKENLEKKLTGEINELTPQHQQIKVKLIPSTN